MPKLLQDSSRTGSPHTLGFGSWKAQFTSKQNFRHAGRIYWIESVSSADAQGKHYAMIYTACTIELTATLHMYSFFKKFSGQSVHVAKD